jgi:hypothetical protein
LIGGRSDWFKGYGGEPYYLVRGRSDWYS